MYTYHSFGHHKLKARLQVYSLQKTASLITRFLFQEDPTLLHHRLTEEAPSLKIFTSTLFLLQTRSASPAFISNSIPTNPFFPSGVCQILSVFWHMCQGCNRKPTEYNSELCLGPASDQLVISGKVSNTYSGK